MTALNDAYSETEGTNGGEGHAERNRNVLKESLQHRFVQMVVSLNQYPMPITKMVSHDQRLQMVNYAINRQNAYALSELLPEMVPANVNKIYLINNSLEEEGVDYLMGSLMSCSNLKTFVYVGNHLSDKNVQHMTNYFFQSDTFKYLSKFAIKDPTPNKMNRKHAYRMLKSIAGQAHLMDSIYSLTLANINMGGQAAQQLATAVQNMSGLEVLDISWNMLKYPELVKFMKSISSKNCLRSLNLSYNNAKAIDVHIADSFEQALCTFVRSSFTLLHLNLVETSMGYK